MSVDEELERMAVAWLRALGLPENADGMDFDRMEWLRDGSVKPTIDADHAALAALALRDAP